MSNPQIPLLHLNGTSYEELEEQYRTALNAAKSLREQLRKATPHDRDYYPRGPLAGTLARQDHAVRILAVDNIIEDLSAIIVGMADQRQDHQS